MLNQKALFRHEILVFFLALRCSIWFQKDCKASSKIKNKPSDFWNVKVRTWFEIYNPLSNLKIDWSKIMPTLEMQTQIIVIEILVNPVWKEKLNISNAFYLPDKLCDVIWFCSFHRAPKWRKSKSFHSFRFKFNKQLDNYVLYSKSNWFEFAIFVFDLFWIYGKKA